MLKKPPMAAINITSRNPIKLANPPPTKAPIGTNPLPNTLHIELTLASKGFGVRACLRLIALTL